MLIKLNVEIENLNNIFEKLKNLLTWQDPFRTIIFLLFLFISYVFFSSISMRILIIIGVI